jgi:SAM-dependent methyltransferase
MNPDDLHLTAHRPAPRQAGLRQRLFAYMMAHSGKTYEAGSAARKQALLGDLHGRVLEIGPGAGPNLRYYAADVEWIGVEPNPFMHPYLRQAIRDLGRAEERFCIDPGDARGGRLPAGDASLDAVVSTLVLCSVPNVEETLREVLRVLKPGGRFVFIEHVAAPHGTRLRTLQNVIQPLWSLVGDGCHPNRETWDAIARAGFAQVEIDHYRYPGAGPASPDGPHIAGQARKG